MKTNIAKFTYKEAVVCIHSRQELIDIAKGTFHKIYDTVENYLKTNPRFQYSLQPVEPTADSPQVITRMAQAAAASNVGPMAAVAGGIAQLTVEAILKNSPKEKIIVENGGDIVFSSPEDILIRILSAHPALDRLALKFPGSEKITAICSSSGKIGHSLSFGQADLVTVIADDGFQADAWATRLANLAKDNGNQLIEEIESALIANQFQAVITIYNQKVYLGGSLPQIVTVKEEENVKN